MQTSVVQEGEILHLRCELRAAQERQEAIQEEVDELRKVKAGERQEDLLTRRVEALQAESLAWLAGCIFTERLRPCRRLLFGLG